MTGLIIALDEPGFDRALEVVEATRGTVHMYKVGYQAFYAYGGEIIDALHQRELGVFLDLKLHDIPNTVATGIKSLARYAPSMLTVHAAGGKDMLEAAALARDQVNAAGATLRLLAVTVLTSLSKEELLAAGEDLDPHEQVAIRAELAASTGMDGIVCAVDDLPVVRARTGESLVAVCPGIRPAGASRDDQRRVATPVEAVLAGAQYIVVGRPITGAPDPGAAARAIAAALGGVKPLGAV
jgi:orotidine-5'-phosphate decarboxylase